MRGHWSIAVLAAVLCGQAGCGDGAGAPEPRSVAVTTELGTSWAMVPHRISELEIAFEAAADGTGGTMIGRNEGGPIGALDSAVVSEAFTVYRSGSLRAVPLSVEIEIPGPGTTDPEDFVATGEASGDGSALEGTSALVAWIRGYRVSTDEYDTPPAFASDPTLPYDPSDGFTTQGLGIQLGDPVLAGGQVSVPVTVRNSLGPSDRPDMNAAIPEASSWVRVDLLVVGAVGGSATVSRGEIDYTLSTATYGQNTVHLHADDATQSVTVQGAPALRSGLVGLRGFDLWVNAPGHIDPTCEVVQDEINAFGDPVSGPGRYVTEMSVRLWGQSYDAATGAASAKVDLYFSNRSTVKEVGNVCFGGRGELSLLQLDADVAATDVASTELPVKQGQVTTGTVTFEGP